MKRFFFKFSLAFFSIFFLLFSVCNQTFAAEESVTVGIYDNPPKVYQDEQGNPQGIWVDVLNEIAKREGWKLNYVHDSWPENLRKLRAGEIDIMVDIAVSEEREEIYTFNKETVFINWGYLYISKSEKVESILDLEGKRIAVLENGIHFYGPLGLKNTLEAFDIHVTHQDYGSYEEVFNAIETGQADVGVVNRIFGSLNVGNYSNIKGSNIIFNPIELKFAFPKDTFFSDYLAERIDDNLIEFKEDNSSVYHQSIRRHLKGVLTETEVIPGWLVYLFGAVLVSLFFVLVVLVLTNSLKRRLQREFDKKTVELKESEQRYKDLFKKAKKLSALRSEFLKIIAHQIRTPLGVISWGTEVLLGNKENFSRKELGTLRDINSASRNIINTVGGVMTVVKIEDGTQTMDKTTANLSKVVDKVIKNMEKQIVEKGLKLKVEDNIKTLSFEFDKEQITTVVKNLLENAVIYSKNKGEIKVILDRKNGNAYFEVRDRGIGIPKSEQNDVFEYFFRASNASKSDPNHTGLGLAIAKYFIEAHGGTIDFSSIEDKGSAFRVELPVK